MGRRLMGLGKVIPITKIRRYKQVGTRLLAPSIASTVSRLTMEEIIRPVAMQNLIILKLLRLATEKSLTTHQCCQIKMEEGILEG